MSTPPLYQRRMDVLRLEAEVGVSVWLAGWRLSCTAHVIESLKGGRYSCLLQNTQLVYKFIHANMLDK